MVNLRTTYMGVDLKNPLIMGAGPTTHTPQICGKAAKAGWAGVVLKTNMADEVIEKGKIEHKVSRPYFKLLDASGKNTWRPIIPKIEKSPLPGRRKRGRIQPDYTLCLGGQFNPQENRLITGIGQLFNGDEKYPYYISKTKELVEKDNCKVIASIAAYTDKGWEQQCNLINRSDADMVELNFGCFLIGYVSPDSGEVVRQAMGVCPDLVEKWTKFCVERIRIPVGVKLPPHCPDPLSSAYAAVKGGAKAILYADMNMYMPPIPPLPIDPETLEVGYFPGLPFARANIPSWTLPYVCGCIAHFRLNGVLIEISGCGGVRNYLDVIRLLMAGSTSVQVCTAAVVEGVEIGRDLIEEMMSWMERKGYKSVKEIIAKVVREDKLKVDPQKFTEAELPQVAGGPPPSVQTKIDKRKCIHCGWCEACCPYLAIRIEDKVPVINEKLCEVCGLCVAICPNNALSIIART